MLFTILKPDITKRVGIQRTERYRLAPARIGQLELFHHQRKDAVKQPVRAFGDFTFRHRLR